VIRTSSSLPDARMDIISVALADEKLLMESFPDRQQEVLAVFEALYKSEQVRRGSLHARATSALPLAAVALLVVACKASCGGATVQERQGKRI
jgi:hypothetical protein